MKAVDPYETKDITEFDIELGDVIHFAAFYEYLFVVVSVEMYIIGCYKNFMKYPNKVST